MEERKRLTGSTGQASESKRNAKAKDEEKK